MNRRNWLTSLAAVATAAQAQKKAAPKPAAALPLSEYEPKSMLKVAESKVPRARFPVIDIHTHLSFSSSLESTLSGKEEKASFPAKPQELLEVMDRRNICLMVNLTGGSGKTLDQVLQYFKAHPDRFVSFTEPTWVRAADTGYPKFQAEELGRARKAGARGLKVLKTLGLYLREQVVKGPLVKVDDKRFDPMWEAAGALKMPVAIHTSDPEAFFLPIDRFNERWEELHAHPDWSFYGKDFPSNRELMEARNRVVERHPRTQFIVLHVGDSEDLAWVSEWLDRYPNMHVEIGARIGELGRQPRTARRFFEKYQDRIMFGTDAIPRGDQYPQQVFGDALYQIYYRFLETEDEYFDYAPARIPPQGRWRIYGLGLPENILRKVYNQNAARFLGVKV
jgi:predicted TIM-barrel fold metal-dependent hydrolase